MAYKKFAMPAKNLGVDEPKYIVHGEDIMGNLWHCKEPKFQTLKLQSDDLNDALGDKLMMLLKENPYLTQREMLEKLSVSRTTVQRLIKKLIDEKKLERVGGKRYGYWMIREYRI